MPFPPLLTRQLTALTKVLDDPATDLETALGAMTGQLRVVVPGFLGLTITVHCSGIPVTLTAVDPAVLGSAQGGLLLALPNADGTRAGGSVVFYAATPGAFRALIEGTDPGNNGLDGVYLIDHHLPLITDLPHPVGISGLDEVTAINQAIGALLAQGSTLVQARVEMRAVPTRKSPSAADAAATRRPGLSPPITQHRSPDPDLSSPDDVPTVQARRPGGGTRLPSGGSGRGGDSPDEVPRLRWPDFDS